MEDAGRRSLRQAYRELIGETLTDSEAQNANLKRTMEKAEQLFGKVTRLPEAMLDSKLMALVSSKGRQLTKTAATDLTTFDPYEFAVRARGSVCRSSGTGPLHVSAWAQLGKLYEGVMKTSIPLWYLHGSAGEVPPRVRQAPTRRQQQETGDRASTVPEQVRSVNLPNRETTTERVGQIHQILKFLYSALGDKPVPYFELVLHPRSFVKTCENIFHLSFLTNEGHARVYCNEHDLLVVEPVDPNESSACREANNNVSVMTLNMEKWQEAVAALNVTEPVIPE